MTKKEIVKHNGEQLLKDLKEVTEVMSYAATSRFFFKIRRMDLKECASRQKVHYYITDEIYTTRRKVMVVI